MRDLQLDHLSPPEKQLWQVCSRGELIDLRSGPTDGPEHAATWERHRHIRAEVIAALVPSPVPPTPGSGRPAASGRGLGDRRTGPGTRAH